MNHPASPLRYPWGLDASPDIDLFIFFIFNCGPGGPSKLSNKVVEGSRNSINRCKRARVGSWVVLDSWKAGLVDLGR